MPEAIRSALGAELPHYTSEDFKLHGANPPECDLVMKGGITSGIVYPYAILKIATQYRLNSLGGTSAGAIASALAAAAEYARQRDDPGGFMRLKERCDALPRIMESLFQPSPIYQDLWSILMSALDDPAGFQKRITDGVAAARDIGGMVRTVAGWAGLGALLGAGGGWWAVESGLLAGQLALAAGVAGGLAVGTLGLGVVGSLAVWNRLKPVVREGEALLEPIRAALADLPKTNYGLCTGLSQIAGHPGITDWIEESLNYVAFGEQGPDRPLLFGDLVSGAAPDGMNCPRIDETKSPLIDLKMVTTNLSANRPHTFPNPRVKMWFSRAEWARLFPKRTMDWLDRHVEASSLSPEEAKDKLPDDLRMVPYVASLPVIVAVRMSLSFPVLFETVPVYAEQLAPNLDPPAEAALQVPANEAGGENRADKPGSASPDAPRRRARFLLSDGGISSNFPTHMFDSPLPKRPTFGFNLASLPADAPHNALRIILPMDARGGFYFEASPITNLVQFASSILGSAKDWQDKLQSELTGQRERTVNIYLSADEGGLNLNMPPERSKRLMVLGSEAGACFVAGGGFEFDEHRWRRAIATFKGMSEYLDRAAQGWTEADYATFLQSRTDANVSAYRSLAAPKNRNLIEDWLSAIVKQAQQQPGLNAMSHDAQEALPKRYGKVVARPEY